MPQKHRRIKVRTKKRRRATMLYILLLFFVLFAAGFLGYRYLRADHILISGNGAIPASEIVALSGIKTGTHLFELDREAAKQSIEQNPYLEVESIEFVLPDTVMINVRERTVTSVIRQLERAVCLDIEGRVLDIIAADDVSGILVVKGVAITGCTLNQTIALVDDYQLEVLKKLVSALLDTNQYASYAEADLTYSVDIWLTTHEGMRVRLGQAVDLEDKLKRVADVAAELYGQGICQGTLIATSADSVTFSPEEDLEGDEQQTEDALQQDDEPDFPSEPGE
ncbi:MAG: cell division protein FtsQ/DivIB [Christensenellales bacterium]